MLVLPFRRINAMACRYDFAVVADNDMTANFYRRAQIQFIRADGCIVPDGQVAVCPPGQLTYDNGVPAYSRAPPPCLPPSQLIPAPHSQSRKQSGQEVSNRTLADAPIINTGMIHPLSPRLKNYRNLCPQRARPRHAPTPPAAAAPRWPKANSRKPSSHCFSAYATGHAATG